MKTLILIVLVTVGYLLGGCMFKHVSEQNLIGKYQADLPDGATEFLELLPKGACVQEIRLKNGTSYKANGTWDYLADSKYIHLRGTRRALTPVGVFNPDIAKSPLEIPLATPVSRSITGSITIMLHEGIDYRKL